MHRFGMPLLLSLGISSVLSSSSAALPTSHVVLRSSSRNKENNRQLQEEEQKVYIAGIFDKTNFPWGEELFKFVIGLLNNHNDGFYDDVLNDGTTIEYLIEDSACDATKASEAYWRVRSQWNALIHGIVGCRCSSATQTVATIAQLENVTMVSPSSTSSALTGYPFFSRTVSPDTSQGQVGALVAMLREFGWERVSIIATDKPYSRDLSTEFQRLWTNSDDGNSGTVKFISTNVKIDPGTNLVVEESVLQVLNSVPTGEPTINSRIILLIGHNEHVYQILQKAQEINFQPDTVFVGPQAWVGRFPKDTSWISSNPGYIGVTPFRNHDDSIYIDLLGRINDFQQVEGKELWTELPDYAAENMVDAILSLALALSSLPHSDRSNGRLVTERLRALTFNGVSGEVRFTEEGNRSDPKFTVFNMQVKDGQPMWQEIGSVTVDSDTGAGDARLERPAVCLASLACGVVPTDTYPVPEDSASIWIPIGFSILIVVVLLMMAKRWRSRQSKERLRKELRNMAEQLEKQMQGMVEVVHDMPIRSAQEYQEKLDIENLESRLDAVSWYWEEDERRTVDWEPSTVLPDTNFISYMSETSGQIEHAYGLWKEGQGYQQYDVDLSDKIEKNQNAHTGLRYKIDFRKMTQQNATSSFERNIRREEQQQGLIMNADVVQALPPLPADIDFEADGEDLLPMIKGQIIQISKVHPKDADWAYGNVLYDPLVHEALDQADQESSGLKAMLAKALHDRPTSGWFPRNAITRDADVNVMQKLLGSFGSDGISTLAPPTTWAAEGPQNMDSASGRHTVPPSSPEYKEVADYFITAMYGQKDKVVVTGVERVQNLPLWQTYAVKRETMKTRDTKTPENRVHNSNMDGIERRWLFHGTSSELLEKIENQGFNRAFAGRNAVVYGKGVYFARDAVYSSNSLYSTPDKHGIQRMFLCRVVVGDWCKGSNGQLTPTPKPHSQLELFDSTVDNVKTPSIFVVYHDSQAYPEYLVSFKMRP